MMIDGIPNQPLYFYLKDIIGSKALFWWYWECSDRRGCWIELKRDLVILRMFQRAEGFLKPTPSSVKGCIWDGSRLLALKIQHGLRVLWTSQVFSEKNRRSPKSQWIILIFSAKHLKPPFKKVSTIFRPRRFIVNKPRIISSEST